MKWILFIGGALIAVTSGMVTLSWNGGTLLGFLIMMWGFWKIANSDVREGL